MLKYILLKNHMAKGDEKYVALVTNTGTKNLDDIIEMMIDEGTGLTRPQALAYFERLMQSIAFWLSQGYAVNTPLVKFKASITGKFYEEYDLFDPERHQIRLRSTPGSRFNDLLELIKPERVRISDQSPAVTNFIDVCSNTNNEQISSGGIAMVRGTQLAFDKDDQTQGIFLQPIDESEPEVRIETYAKILPKEVHLQLPAIAAGEYVCTVRTRGRNGKVLCTGSLKTTLTTAA